ncbi:MAG TPA: MBL fold metallo-hydrolase [Candidatus Chromulinivoraceae bacterium]|nr:MBL fold metallo-hydrolase [Candidatus Chromulinivoraceae bacterium]
MKLTKYEHACFTVQKDVQLLVVDPGGLSADFIAPSNVVGVVITHEHGDHFDLEQIANIMDKNPDAIIVGPRSVTSHIETFTSRTIEPGDKLTIGMFQLEFFGGEHAEIHRTIPIIPNVGVLIDDLLYYGGDSYTLPKRPVDTLAVPAGAPWLKMGEAMDYMSAIKPRFAFPTHDAVLSDTGKEFADGLFAWLAERYGIEYKRLEEPVEI